MNSTATIGLRLLAAALWCGTLATASQAWSAPAPSRPVAASSGAPDADGGDADAQIAAEQREQQRLLKLLRAQVANMPASSPERAQKERLLAYFERRIAEESGLRVQYMSATRLADEVFGAYCVKVRRAIETQGTAHFPSEDGRKLYGHATLNLRIDSAGRLVEAVLVHSSGNPALDESARGIAEASAPFDPFTASMAGQADQIVYTAGFNFVHDDAASAPAASSH